MRIVYLSLTILFSLSLSAQTVTTTVIKKPSELRCNEVPVRLNNIVFGAVPPNSADKPVVVYIHGWFDNGYAWFMAKNKWYENSYNAGYKTAFFFQSVSGAFEDNGKVIAQMIRETCRHYNTDRVIAVCHSKGGFDIEWALYNENVWDSVQGVVTISTPFWGAPMSDMIAVPFFRTILEAIPIVGPIFQGKGSYQMQTAYMAGVIRPMMDNHPNNRPEKFHCYASWGYNHPTVFPNAIPDDILKVVFPDYQPVCWDIPGFGVFAGDLMTGFMTATGLLTSIAAVQPRYENPQNNHQLNDGLAPYYSSLRPGAVSISQPPPSQQSNLNHIDVLLSSNMWNIVQPEIEYFKNNPVFRKGNVSEDKPNAIETPTTVSDLQLVQSNNMSVNTFTQNKLFLIGNYKNEMIKVYDDAHRLVNTINLNVSTQAMYDIFHEVDLSFLQTDKQYTLEASVQMVGLLKDGKTTSIQLNTNESGVHYKDEPLNVKVALTDWTDAMGTTTVKGYLNRNMDENGNVIYDRLIPLTFQYDEMSNAFVCSDKMDLPNGIYNVSVFAEGNSLKRFTTTSILMQQERKQITDDSRGAFKLYPNPATGNFNVEFNASTNDNYSIQLTDITGKILMAKEINNAGGLQQIQFSSKENMIAKGTYVVTLHAGTKTSSKLLVVD